MLFREVLSWKAEGNFVTQDPSSPSLTLTRANAMEHGLAPIGATFIKACAHATMVTGAKTNVENAIFISAMHDQDREVGYRASQLRHDQQAGGDVRGGGRGWCYAMLLSDRHGI